VTPGARLAAAIEILDRIEADKVPADQALKAWGKHHRFAGSGDRRAIAERVYQALRGRAASAWRLGEDGRALTIGSLVSDGMEPEDIAALFSGEAHSPPPLTQAEQDGMARDLADAPDWARAGVPPLVAEIFKAQFGDDWLAEAQAVLAVRAPVDLRVNGLAGGVEGALNLLALGEIKPEPAPYSAWGLRLPPALAADVQKTRPYKSGWIEVQDEGSQITAALAGARPGWTVVDYCAGAGGKTLALAAQMRREGRLVATDLDAKRLGNITERLQRAGAKAEVRQIGHDGQGTEDLEAAADLVFVDAPCTGSGTWRRHPEGAWRLRLETVERLAALQLKILSRASRLVKPGGRLTYVTCSMIEAENTGVTAAFAAAHPQFRPLPIATAAATPDLTDALIIDFGSQVTQLIARRVREERASIARSFPSTRPMRPSAKKPKAVILSGGPEPPLPRRAVPRAPAGVFEMGVPVLGICYGEMTMSTQLGGKVESRPRARIRPRRHSMWPTARCWKAWPKAASDPVWMSHGDRITASRRA
jgi:16S rRNA (cytosine967-C5)-methyltransferase